MRALLSLFTVCLVLLGLAPSAALAQAIHASQATPVGDDMPMADYLALLAQIAPAARDGAQAYLQAFQQRCGRAMRIAELRRAMSEGDGDPALMGLIRASQLRNTPSLAQQALRVRCNIGGSR